LSTTAKCSTAVLLSRGMLLNFSAKMETAVPRQAYLFFPWPNSPTGALTDSWLRFLDLTHTTRTHPGGLLCTTDQLTATYTTHKEHNRRTSMPSTGLGPQIPAIKRLKTNALGRTATGIGQAYFPGSIFYFHCP